MTQRLQPALKRQCRLQGDGGHVNSDRKVFLVVCTVLHGVDVTHYKTVQASTRVNGTLTFLIFSSSFLNMYYLKFSNFPHHVIDPFAPFFLPLPPLVCVLG